MSEKGWISLHRSIFDHWLKPEKPFSKFEAWVDLLVKANHAPAKVMLKEQLISIERGQQARSMLTLSKEWGWSRDKVRRYIKQLEVDGMVVVKTSHLTSIISICNYNKYQQTAPADNTTSRQQTIQQADNRQVTNNKNNNVNNENKRFVKPEVSEVQGYMIEQKFGNLAQKESIKFVDYYQANGWKVGKNPMKDWKAAVRNWKKRLDEYNKNSSLQENSDFSKVNKQLEAERARQ